MKLPRSSPDISASICVCFFNVFILQESLKADQACSGYAYEEVFPTLWRFSVLSSPFCLSA